MADIERASSGETVAPPAGMVGEPGPLLRIARDQRVAFLAVGVVNTVIGLAWFMFFQVMVGRFVHYLVVLMMAHVASVLCAFVLYRRVVFQVRGHLWRDLVRFELVYLTGLAVNFAALLVLVEIAGFPVLPTQSLIVGLTALVSFFGHRNFSFRRPPSVHEEGRWS